jgi:phosphate transport system permease protein
MTDASLPYGGETPRSGSLHTLDARTKKRNASEKRFRGYGIAAIATGILFLWCF